jgi:hypothetical protein
VEELQGLGLGLSMELWLLVLGGLGAAAETRIDASTQFGKRVCVG